MKYGVVVYIMFALFVAGQASGSLIGHYELDGSLADSAPLGDNPTGVFGGNAAYTNVARFGSHAVHFDGDDDYVSLGDNFDVGTSDWTVAAWVKTSEKNFHRIVSKEGTGGFNISLNATLGVGCTLSSHI